MESGAGIQGLIPNMSAAATNVITFCAVFQNMKNKRNPGSVDPGFLRLEEFPIYL